MFRSIFKFLASLKLALLLLAIIIVSTIQGTIYESSFNADVAKKYIYSAPWFNAWLVMLCINLFAVAAIRYPWKPHQTGFVITHAGIIILLIGGLIDRQYGIEGFIPLYRGDPPTDILRLHEEELQVYAEGKKDPARTPVRLKELLFPDDFKFKVATPADDIKVEVLDVRPPVAQVVLQGAMMGRNEEWLFEGDTLNLGPASLEFEHGMPPEAKPAAAMVELHVFNKRYSLPIQGNEGRDYNLEGLKDWKARIVKYYANLKMQDGVPTDVGGPSDNPAVLLELVGPLVPASQKRNLASPHGNASKKDEPKTDEANSGEMIPRLERHFVFANQQFPGAPIVGEPTGAETKLVMPRNGLTLYFGDDGKLRYLLKSRKEGERAGEVALNKPIPVGWAPGSEFMVQSFYPDGVTKHIHDEPEKFKKLNNKRLEQVMPGLLCRVNVGSEGKIVWVPQMNPNGFTPVSATVGSKLVELALPGRFVQLPFKIALEKFDAPHDEGNPMSFSEFRSTLSFADKSANADAPSTKKLDFIKLPENSKYAAELGLDKAVTKEGSLLVYRGAITDLKEEELTFDLEDRTSVTVPIRELADFNRQTHKIYMNHPTTYPEVWYGPWLGTTYKFSQAGHDMPRNPDYSGIQVLRDPGWMPKWVGCLMICFGIFTMFYLKPYFNRRPSTVAAAAPVAEGKRKIESAAAEAVARQKA